MKAKRLYRLICKRPEIPGITLQRLIDTQPVSTYTAHTPFAIIIHQNLYPDLGKVWLPRSSKAEQRKCDVIFV
jgi:hypothetical protein